VRAVLSCGCDVCVAGDVAQTNGITALVWITSPRFVLRLVQNEPEAVLVLRVVRGVTCGAAVGDDDHTRFPFQVCAPSWRCPRCGGHGSSNSCLTR